MPLLVISGFPASGKTSLATRIKKYFKSRSVETIVVEDQLESGEIKHIGNDFKKEKECRSLLRSKVQKVLNSNTIVICDSLNYIKGFRYELYCVAKQLSTTYAILYCRANPDTCKWLNAQRAENERYDSDTMLGLMRRFEAPDARNRWDAPLFEVRIGNASMDDCGESLLRQAADDFDAFLNDATVSTTDTTDDNAGHQEKNPAQSERILPDDASIPFEELFNVLIKGKALRPNQATQSLAPKATSSFLHEMDQLTQKMVTNLLEKQRNAIPGDKLFVAEVLSSSSCGPVVFSRQRTLAELTRLRRQFLNYARTHAVDNIELVPPLFVDFINSN